MITAESTSMMWKFLADLLYCFAGYYFALYLSFVALYYVISLISLVRKGKIYRRFVDIRNRIYELISKRLKELMNKIGAVLTKFVIFEFIFVLFYYSALGRGLQNLLLPIAIAELMTYIIFISECVEIYVLKKDKGSSRKK